MSTLKDDVTARLKMLGCEVAAADDWALDFCIDRAAHEICDACGLDDVPDGLHDAQVDRAAGAFLSAKYAVGGLSEEQTQKVVQQVNAGDTTVQFAADATPQQRINAAIGTLCAAGSDRFSHDRKLVW